MAEPISNEQYPEFAQGSRANFRFAYLVTLITAMLALVMILFSWLYNPAYVVLIQKPDPTTLSQVSSELQKNNIAYQYDSVSGSVLVPEKSLYHARFVLGSKGVEQGAMSQLLQASNYPVLSKRENPKGEAGYFALESELAKTISSINDIQWSRVHLAVQSDQINTAENNSRASVFVKLENGRVLAESQLNSISHLVAASVPHLTVKNITIIDQAGNLLKSTGDDKTDSGSSMRFSYTRMLEQTYINKIEDLLKPIFGERAVRVRVDATVKFQDAQQSDMQPMAVQASHVVKKISVTVVIDNKHVSNDSGQLVSVPRTKNELDKIETLVKETIGFDEQRGDRINVFNEAFSTLMDLRQDDAYFTEKEKMYYLKAILAAILSIVLFYIILKLLIKKTVKSKYVGISSVGKDARRVVSVAENENGLAHNSLEEKTGITEVKDAYESILTQVRKLVDENPAHVAKVLRTWVRDNGR